jgi:hypothetical protein
LSAQSDGFLADAKAMVGDYIRARHQWESVVGAGFDERHAPSIDDESTQREYEEILRTYCAQRVLALDLRYTFGNPPSVDPTSTDFLEARRAGEKAVLTTSEASNPPDIDTFEYVVMAEGGRIVIAERRYRIPAGGWIRDVF